MGKKKKRSKKDLKRIFSEQFQSTVRKSRIKECLHPKKNVARILLKLTRFKIIRSYLNYQKMAMYNVDPKIR